MNKTRIALLTVALIVGAACSSTSDPSNVGGQSKTGTATPAATQAAAVPAAPTEAAPPAQKGPWTSFADGTYEVGTGDGMVSPGKYRTTVPADSFGCYWARLKSTSGELGSILANDLVSAGQPSIVTIVKGDAAFRTERCGTWAKA